MSSKSKAMEPVEPLTSMRIAFLRPQANRLASRTAGAPLSSRAVNRAASSTVTGPRSVPAVPWRPLKLSATGRSLTNVSIIPETPRKRWPVTNWVRSMMWAPMSPSAPEPAFSLSSRHESGASASASQSWRYWARGTGAGRPAPAVLRGDPAAPPDPPPGDEPPRELARGDPPVGEADHRPHAVGARCVGCCGHLLGLGDRVGHRLLHEDVLAGLEGGDRDLGVRVSRCTDVDDVDVVTLDDPAPVGRSDEHTSELQSRG